MIKIEIHSTRAAIRYQEPLTVGLRGAKVRFSFGSPWEGLSKIAVFRQGEKTVTVADVGEEVIIPWEVLTQPGSPVQIGVYGRDSTGTVAIPTVWTETAAVRPGADPEGDPSTEPTPGLWEQLQGKMGSLEKLNAADKSSLVGAINEANRAFCLVTVTKNEDGSYSADKTSQQLLTAKNMGKVLLCQLDSLWLTLSSVYNTATFEFTTVKKNTKCCITIHPDGTISYQADVLATGESRLPNPKKITITGASTAEYDGSDEVEVQVPYKTSQLENDSGFLTTAPVTSVNGQTGEVKLPTVVKVPLIRQEDGTYKPGISHEDILAAYHAGNFVFCEYSGRLLPLIVASRILCSFGCVHSGNVYTVNINSASAVASVVPLASGGGSGSGSDGITPHIGANGNWFIGETDTGMPSRGEPGPQGVSGVYVGPGEIPEGYNIQIDPTGEAPVLVQSVNGVKPDENGNVEVPTAPDSEYTLPIATPDTLGGVKPAAKTEDMTQPVGVDELGCLWSVPGTGGGNNEMELIAEGITTEEANCVLVSLDTNGQPFELEDYYMIWNAKTNSITGNGIVSGHYRVHSYEKELIITSYVCMRANDTLSGDTEAWFYNLGQIACSAKGTANKTAMTISGNIALSQWISRPITGITVSMNGAQEKFASGATYKLYGRRVKK